MYSEKLQTLNVDRMDLDELVELAAGARGLKVEYETLQLEVPVWLDDASRTLRREINARQQDSIEKAIREKRARLDALEPIDKKRDRLAQELAELESRRQPQPA